MPRLEEPDAILGAFIAVWINEAIKPDESREEIIAAFAARWEGLDVNALPAMSRESTTIPTSGICIIA